MKGVWGRILEIDLSREKFREIEVDEDIFSKFLGGRGLGTYLLFKEFGKTWRTLDPMSPEIPLYFLTGPLTGYYPGAKLCVIGKSPLTGGTIGSVLSTELAIELKACGYDGIVLRGASKDPVYIFVRDGEVEIRSAEKYWGMRSKEFLQEFLPEIYYEVRRRGNCKRPGLVYIGPAGERGVRIAAIMSKLTHAAGYGVYGGVMGIKKVKAIVAKGFGPMPEVKDTLKVKTLLRKIWERLSRNNVMRNWGTAEGAFDYAYAKSSEPVRNWKSEWHDRREIGATEFERKYWKKKYWADYGCPVACMKISVLKEGERTYVTDAPDYELIAYAGSNLGVFDAKGVVKISALYDALGLCGIQTGNVLGFATELLEEGILSKEDLGVDLKWGNVQAFCEALEKISKKEGIWEIFSEGTYRACRALSKSLGRDLSKYAVQSKGVGIGAHGVRSKLDFYCLGYACSVQGGDHTSSIFQNYEDVWSEPYLAFSDSAVICNFTVVDQHVWEFYRAVTGERMSKEEWFSKGARRILSLQRILLLLGGPDVKWDPRKDDDLPPRFYEPLPEGPKKGEKADKKELEEAKRSYYEYLGWDPLGIPKEETLREIGLEEAIGLVEALRREFEAQSSMRSRRQRSPSLPYFLRRNMLWRLREKITRSWATSIGDSSVRKTSRSRLSR